MRKVISGAFVSLDCVMQTPGGPQEDRTRGFELGGWVVPYMDEVFGQAINEMLRAMSIAGFISILCLAGAVFSASF